MATPNTWNKNTTTVYAKSGSAKKISIGDYDKFIGLGWGATAPSPPAMTSPGAPSGTIPKPTPQTPPPMTSPGAPSGTIPPPLSKTPTFGTGGVTKTDTGFQYGLLGNTPAKDNTQVDVFKDGKKTTVLAWQVPDYTARGYTSSYTPQTPPPITSPGAPSGTIQQPAPSGTPAAQGAYQPTLIEIASARPDVLDTAKAQGGDPFTAGTKANTWLNDWYNRVGKAEGADMASKGMFGGTGTTGATDTTATDTGATGKTKPKTSEDMFKEMTDLLKTSQDEAKKSQDDLLAKTTEDTMKQFQDMQKSMMDGYNSYFDEQSKYLEDIKNQPSMVDQLNQFREQQGLPQMEQMLKGIDQTILDTEGLLTNLEADVRQRTEGLPVSEAAARRLTAMEQKPLTKQMDEMLRSRARAAAGLEQKQATVNQYMTSAQADIENQREAARDRLGFAKDKMDFVSDMASKSFDMFSGLQDKMFDIKSLEITNDREYKNKLAEVGFDFFTQQQAAIAAKQEKGEEFERELLIKQFEADLKSSNPEVKSVQSFTDAGGNVTQMITYTNGQSEQISLGRIGKGFAPKTGDTYSQKDLDKLAADKEKAFWTEIDQGKAMLQKGENWGSVWNRIKTQFPEIPDEVIDQVLGKEDWYEEGAFEKFKSSGKTSSSSDDSALDGAIEEALKKAGY